jgi:hypothetical protein
MRAIRKIENADQILSTFDKFEAAAPYDPASIPAIEKRRM